MTIPRLIPALLALFLLTGPAPAQETFVLNLRDTDVSVLAEQVSAITGRTLILDPALSGEVTVISSQELDADGIWALFQSILRSRGFVAVRSDAIWEVVPEGEARSRAALQRDLGRPGTQDVVTRLLRLDRLPASEAVRVLGPLVAQTGYIEALADPNAIVISDTAANVERLFEIARTFDADAGVRAEVLRFRFARADLVGAAITEVLGEAGTRARISVDPDGNTLLVRGSPAEIAQVSDLARAMDVAPRESPREAVSNIVYRLDYADAETVASLVATALGGAATDGAGGTAATNAVADALAGEDTTFTPTPDAPAPQVAVAASTETNAVIVRGTAAQLDEARALIAALDQPRPQVMIEAAIVEVSGDVADRLGVQLGLANGVPQGGFAATAFANGGTTLQTVLATLGATGGQALSTGLTVTGGAGDFGALIQAFAQSSRANLLSTPSVTTMDNRPATIVVGQNVPFRTGSFATDGNTLTPFTTIERRDVGITMQVLPRVTAGGIVRLEIAQEVSSLAPANIDGAADLVTNRRVIETTVEALSGGTVVLGGLISDDRTTTENRVPGLGDVPGLGRLFRSRGGNASRRTLFVFLRPTVLTNQRQLNAVAQGRLDRLGTAETRALPPARRVGDAPAVRRLPLEINGLY